MIHFKIFVDSPNIFSGIEQLRILFGGSNNALKFFLDILESTCHVINLNIRVLFDADHPA
jgi:hypothetical protein